MISTLITYTISEEWIAEKFTKFLEEECIASKELDQSTYVSSLDRADVKDRIQHWLEDEANAVPDFTFEAEDHITLYYACGQIQRISIDLKCYRK